MEGRQWRHEPVGAFELIRLLRQVSAACFLVTAYLSGVRTGEALNLRRGHHARHHTWPDVQSGQQMKTAPDRRERSTKTIPWVVTTQVARAEVLEQIAVGRMLFPAGKICSQSWFAVASSRSRTPGRINEDIRKFIDWFNVTIAPATSHPVIPPDEHGRIIAPRLRRTLAWHIVRRPGGTLAGATQYGHLYTQIDSRVGQ